MVSRAPRFPSPPPSLPSAPRSRLLWLAAALLTCGCFEEPVTERLALRFDAEGGVTVTAVTELRPDQLAQVDLSTALGRRLEETERALLAGEDDGARRFSRLEPLSETFRWEKRGGRLARVERTAWLEDPRRLENFFADTAVLAAYTEVPEEGWAELALYPGSPGTQLRRRERERLETATERWTEAVAAHLAAAEELYRYLEHSPGRAEAVLPALFAELLDDPGGDLPPQEARLVDAVSEATEELFEVLVVEPGEAYSLNELSRRLYDPFPARVTVEVAGEILDVEGFLPAPDRPVLRVPELGLWAALEGLEGRWLTPDPALAYVRMARTDDEAQAEAELAAFLSAPRWAAPAPDAGQVRDVLEVLLTPEPAYRVVWRTGRTAGNEEQP